MSDVQVREREERAKTSTPAAPTAAAPPAERVVIEPSGRFPRPDLAELWRSRELVFFLVWRDLKVRYKQTVLRGAWAILQPLVTMLIFGVVFGHFAHIPSSGLPYPLFAYIALLPWWLFSGALTKASESLLAARELVTKTYFPRLAIPLAPVIASLVDFGFASVVGVGLLIYYKVTPQWTALLLPCFILLALSTAWGIGLWLSALSAKYRDVTYVLPFVVQVWLFLTPVIYPSTFIPVRWKPIYDLNPMVGVVNGFRWALLGIGTAPGPSIVASIVVTAVVLVSGLFFFRRRERMFADLI